jgi:hypothetical protein
VTAIRQQYNENAKQIERTWGGGIQGTKSQAATAKLERQIEKEKAKKGQVFVAGRGANVLSEADDMDAINYRPKTRESRAGYEEMLALVQGALTTGAGVTLSTTITTQIKGQVAEWETTGKMMMGAFLVGAQAAITPTTGEAFIKAIWPWLFPLVQSVTGKGYRE